VKWTSAGTMCAAEQMLEVVSARSQWCVIQGDCTQMLRKLPDECATMFWTDPPYGHSNADGDLLSQRHKVMSDQRSTPQKAIANDDGESMKRVVDEMLKQAARIMCGCCCCCCCCCGGGGPSPTFAWVASRMDEQGLQFFHSVIWDKKNPGMGWRYRRQHEMVMVAHRKGGKIAWAEENTTQANVISLGKPKAAYHPNEKPLELVLRFIRLHTKPGDLVIDPFCGSGTTGVACVMTGRRFIGIELEEEYCETSRRRIGDVEPTLLAGLEASKAAETQMELHQKQDPSTPVN